jgi:hypothetical protein
MEPSYKFTTNRIAHQDGAMQRICKVFATFAPGFILAPWSRFYKHFHAPKKKTKKPLSASILMGCAHIAKRKSCAAI